jgi:hypothetical protein
MSDEKNVPSWWTTLPGVITAVTGLLTAVGGLLVVLNTVGVFHNSSGHSAQEGTSASQAAPSLPGDPRAAEKTEPESESKWDALVDVANLPSGYNHAVRIGNLILDYQSSSGAAEVRRIDGSGNTSIVKSYPSGQAGPTLLVLPTASFFTSAVVKVRLDVSMNRAVSPPSYLTLLVHFQRVRPTS